MAEDRGDAEWARSRALRHSLFDLARPTFLYGLVCGISSTDVRLTDNRLGDDAVLRAALG